MDIAVITIGDEILIGQTVDTNSAWIGKNLNHYGFAVKYRISVRDRESDIEEAIAAALDKADVTLITGGLGPTNDDITKKVLCAYFEASLVLHEPSLEIIKQFVKHRGYTLNENNKLQAMVPDKCTALLNHKGTAPGMWFEKNGKILIALPGVPYEMIDLMEKEVIPRLSATFNLPPVEHRFVQTHGIPEAYLADKLRDFESNLPTDIKLAYLPSQGIIKLRLSVYNTTIQTQKALDLKLKELCSVVPEYIITLGDDSFQEIVGKKLLLQKKSLAVAESCTGGYIAHLITQIPGCSQWFNGGVVAYSNEVKINLLGVKEETLAKFGAVSVEVAEQMAKGVLTALNSNYAVATTGIAGPDGGTSDKPVGTVCIAIASAKGIISKKYQFGNDRKNNITRTANTALAMLIRELQ